MVGPEGSAIYALLAFLPCGHKKQSAKPDCDKNTIRGRVFRSKNRVPDISMKVIIQNKNHLRPKSCN